MIDTIILEEIQRLKSENDTHCGAILALENWKKEVEGDSKSCLNSMQQQAWQKNILERLEKLENLIKDNPGLIERIGILGTALHELSGENNKLRAIQEDYKNRFERIAEQISSIKQTYILINEHRQRIEKLENHFSGDYQLVASKLIPHKCPVCNGDTRINLKQPLKVEIDNLKGTYFSIGCAACEGKGIVWG